MTKAMEIKNEKQIWKRIDFLKTIKKGFLIDFFKAIKRGYLTDLLNT